MYIKRSIAVLLIALLAVTSCLGTAPAAFAETAADMQDEVIQDETVTEDGEQELPEEPGEPSVPEEEPVPEPVINGWDEDGYYHGSDGNIVTACILEIDSKTYSFNKSGKAALYTGIYKSYYYYKGAKVTKYKNKVVKIYNGKFYYFNKDGSVFTGNGWKRVNGKRYYFKSGAAYTGWHYIGSYKYYFHKSTASLCQDLIACQGRKWKKKDLYIKVNRKHNLVTIYARDGKKGYTIPVKALTCSVGKAKTPTIKGTYTMKAGKGRTYRWHILGGPSLGVGYSYGQYCVRIHKSWLFHSVTYNKKNKMTLQTSAYNNLGKAASRGCIRLQVKDAKLIYDIVKYRNTKVKIYDSDYAGPFDKPVIKKIPAKQKYDPTDPSVKKK